MKNKGFTLIELLAVIVILAIIALIATPIILGIINNAKDEANERSIEMYANAIKNAVARYQLNGGEEITGNYSSETLEDKITIDYDGNVECTTIQLSTNGSIYLAGCSVNGTSVDYTYGTKQPMCIYKDLDNSESINLSDEITCGTESFYVMSTDNTNKTVTMLSKYNLNVGNNPYSSGTIGIQNENAVAGNINYAPVAFSTVVYWTDSNGNLLSDYGQKYPAFVYDSNSNLYQYVNEYELYLKDNLKVGSASATIMSYEQAINLGCTGDNYLCISAPEWVYSTTYWIGSACDNNNCVWGISYIGSFHGDTIDDCFGYNFDSYLGVRPVITISMDEIKTS